LFQGEQVEARIHHAAGYDNRRHIYSGGGLKAGGHSLVAACEKHAGIKRGCPGVNFN
jgi:hypothetical protein